MTDLFLPDVRLAKVSPRLIDQTGRFVSPLSGATRTVGRPGDRWGFRLDYSNLLGFDRARLESFIARQRGATNRVLFSPVIEYPQRGSFPSQELFLNNNFAAGSANWTPGAGVSIAALDRRLRITYLGSAQFQVTQGIGTFTLNQPYVVRYFFADGLGGLLAGGALSSYIEGSGVINSVITAEGLNVITLAPDAAGTQYLVWGTGGGGVLPTGLYTAGVYVDALWTSLSRCFVVDNAPNLLQQSNAFGTSPWSLTYVNSSNNGTAAPDGSLSAQYLQENVATNVEHYTTQTVNTVGGVADYTFSVSLQASARGWAVLRLYNGGNDARAFFNISTGALGSTSLGGTHMSNVRSSIVPQGNGWYRCTVTGQKDATLSFLQAIVESSTGDGVFNYTGAVNTVPLLMWHGSMSQSSFATADTLTTTSAAAATPQTGSALKVKGLPPSVAGNLLIGDWVEVNKELKRLSAQLDSDASGRGYLQFSPPLRNSPADGDPVIVNRPFGRFIFSGQETGWSTVPGYFATSSIDLQESGS